ncbi:glycosyltransferase [Microbulbifer sp. Q7]|uniref:glycosyltransferase n=1 Tax=Microbulbifer sp. Q7 TaxID=1785091 RepID=UPI00187CE753|nr:glycosyltransferase [Microbulbifer sp. Q7]
MKILFATMQFGPEYNQGTERYIRNVGKELIEDGYEVTVAGGDPEGKGHREGIWNSIPYKTIPTYGWTTVSGASIDWYVELLRKEKPDILHMVNPGHIGVNIIFAARALHIPYLVSVTDFWWLCPKQTLTLSNGSLCDGFTSESTCLKCIAKTHRNPTINLAAKTKIGAQFTAQIIKSKNIESDESTLWKNRRQILQEALSGAHKVICLSKTGKVLLENYFNLKNCQYLPAGLSARWFEQKTSSSVSTNKFSVGFLGAITPHKGLHVLTQALKALDNERIQLIIAGKRALPTYADRELQRYKKTTYLGEIKEEDTTPLMDKLDLIVLPSLWPENQPQVLLEAGARRVPVIASDIPGCAELLDQSALFPMGSQKALSNLIKKITNNEIIIPKPNVSKSAKEIAKKIILEYKSIIEKNKLTARPQTRK